MSAIRENYSIRLYDTDAAGILFYGSQFKIAHDIFSAFLNKIGFSLRDRVTNKDFYFPIVHTEADYMKTLIVGDPIEVALTVENVGNTSFILLYEIFTPDGELAGTAKTVHVTVAASDLKKIKIPEEFKKQLLLYQGK